MLKRTAKKLSLEEFKKLFDPIGEYDSMKDIFYKFPYVLGLGQVERDFMHIHSSGENFSMGAENHWGRKSPNSHLYGFHEIDGFSFFGFGACGDWEVAVFYIVYFDGKQFRGYVPTEGNTFNRTTQSAYGNDQLADLLDLQLHHSEQIDKHLFPGGESCTDFSLEDWKENAILMIEEGDAEEILDNIVQDPGFIPNWEKVRQDILKNITLED